MGNKILIIFLIISRSYSYAQDFVMPDSIDELKNAYAVLTERATANTYPRQIGEVSIFEIPSSDIHVGDVLNLKNPDAKLYYLDVQNIKNISRVEINFDTMELMECSFVDPFDNKRYRFIKFQKDIYNVNGKLERTVEQYLKITDSPSAPRIKEVFEPTEENNSYYLSPCKNIPINSANQEQIISLQQQIENLHEKAIQIFREKDYLQSLVLLMGAKKLDGNNITTQEYIESVTSKIDLNYINKAFEKALENSINIAQKNLQIYIDLNLINAEQTNSLKKRIEEKSKEEKNNLEFGKANYFFEEEMYQQALPIYQALKNDGFNAESLEQRIEACKDADPELIQKRIKNAYNAAVASRKNYHATFKTYYKYENSGYLQGTNFHFMCLMMIDKNNKDLLRDMGLSPNQAKNLAIKYFYQARNMGINNRDVEFIVFTKNFAKNKK
ncbi:MAG: hypothetical protein Q8O88_02965 [bacterium]|nr:hypothetical protein [bacterium]